MRLRVLAQQLKNRGVRVAVLTTGFVVVGHFAAYTFISPILQEISGVAQRMSETCCCCTVRRGFWAISLQECLLAVTRTVRCSRFPAYCW